MGVRSRIFRILVEFTCDEAVVRNAYKIGPEEISSETRIDNSLHLYRAAVSGIQDFVAVENIKVRILVTGNVDMILVHLHAACVDPEALSLVVCKGYVSGIAGSAVDYIDPRRLAV